MAEYWVRLSRRHAFHRIAAAQVTRGPGGRLGATGWVDCRYARRPMARRQGAYEGGWVWPTVREARHVSVVERCWACLARQEQEPPW